VRLLILETIDGETAGECVACPLPAATWMWRWQGKATNINRAHRVKALSTVMNAGGTPVRLLILEIVASETAGNHVMSSVALPRPGVSIAANAHPGPRVSRVCCLTDSPGGDPGWTVARRLGNACRHCDISWVTPRENTPLRRLTIRSNAIASISRKRSPTRLKPSPGMVTNAYSGPVVSRICCLTDSPGRDIGWTVTRRLGNACRHCDISCVTPRGNTPLMTVAAPG